MFSVQKNPDAYHGSKKSSNYFEGWYFRLLQPKTGHNIALIPGIIKSSMEGASHSFIQILNGKSQSFNYIRFPYVSFIASNKEFKFAIDNNIFSLNKLELNIHSSEIDIRGSLQFYSIKTWPDTFINPGSMGFYNYIPFMQCYSQVCALSGRIKGSLFINGKELNFDGGTMYIEKNWGKSFPNSWIWIHCSSFKVNSLTLTCSIAHIPFLFGSFRGFLIGMYYKDEFYKFTTINRSRINIEKSYQDVLITAHSKKYSLTLKAHSSKDEFLTINGPRDNKMIPLVEESLSGKLDLQLIDNFSNRKIVEDQGYYAGIEYGGDKNMITKNL